MGAWDAIDIGSTGAFASQLWLDVLADNLANVNTVHSPDEEPFRAKLVYAREALDGPGGRGSGVQVVALLADQGDPRWVWSPDHPLADEEGYVVHPVVDVAGQMSDLIIAQRSYQLNLQSIKSSREAYEAALRIGR